MKNSNVLIDPIQDIKIIEDNIISQIANKFNLPVFYVKDNYTPNIDKNYRGCIMIFKKTVGRTNIINVCVSYKPDITCDNYMNLFFSIKNRLVKCIDEKQNILMEEIYYLDNLSIIGAENMNISQNFSISNSKHLPKELKYLKTYYDVHGILTYDNIDYIKNYFEKTVKKFINILERNGDVLSKYVYDKKSIFKKVWLEFKLNRLIR